MPARQYGKSGTAGGPSEAQPACASWLGTDTEKRRCKEGREPPWGTDRSTVTALRLKETNNSMNNGTRERSVVCAVTRLVFFGRVHQAAKFKERALLFKCKLLRR